MVASWDFVAGERRRGPAGGRMPGAAEPAKRRAQPGALDLLEANPANPKIEREIHATSSHLLFALVGSSDCAGCGSRSHLCC
jgi:hypothetical protein